MTIEAVRELTSRLQIQALAYAAVGLALEARASDNPLDPKIAPLVDEALRALGATGVLEGVSAAEAKPALASIRTDLAQGAKWLEQPRRAGAWSYSEAEVLQAAGDVSGAFPQLLKQVVAPKLAGLVERLEAPTATFLDIGTGVASLAIEMARAWPQLRVTGIDPWQPSLALARENVKRAGLASRIELREQAAEALPDAAAFDLVWVPAAFINEAVLASVLRRVQNALRPGAWALIAMQNPTSDPLTAALIRLRNAFWGGVLKSPEETTALLKQAGFGEVLAPPPMGPLALVCARKT